MKSLLLILRIVLSKSFLQISKFNQYYKNFNNLGRTINDYIGDVYL